jgi:hypothetical protein
MIMTGLKLYIGYVIGSVLVSLAVGIALFGVLMLLAKFG